MKFLTLMIVPDGAKSTKSLRIPRFFVKTLIIISLVSVGCTGFFLMDYYELRNLRSSYKRVLAENEGLKGEARLLMSNLETVKRSLGRVHDYSQKLGNLTNLKVRKVSKKTGIGPLTPDEARSAESQYDDSSDSNQGLPLGIDMERLIFRPVFDQLTRVGQSANRNAIELQYLLSKLGKQKSLLQSIPSISPVNGWITSGFGPRISPFTGNRNKHKGIDLASPIGTPIYAPADGVVIFTGAKHGFGNFIMIAHGYGIVSRYGHNAQNMVQPGQKVRRGDQIATVGMTGRTTGPHLHYEVLVNGLAVNPRKFILNMSY